VNLSSITPETQVGTQPTHSLLDGKRAVAKSQCMLAWDMSCASQAGIPLGLSQPALAMMTSGVCKTTGCPVDQLRCSGCQTGVQSNVGLGLVLDMLKTNPTALILSSSARSRGCTMTPVQLARGRWGRRYPWSNPHHMLPSVASPKSTTLSKHQRPKSQHRHK